MVIINPQTYLIDFGQRCMVVVHHGVDLVVFRQRIVAQGRGNGRADLVYVHAVLRTLVRRYPGREAQRFRPLGQTANHLISFLVPNENNPLSPTRTECEAPLGLVIAHGTASSTTRAELFWEFSFSIGLPWPLPHQLIQKQLFVDCAPLGAYGGGRHRHPLTYFFERSRGPYERIIRRRCEEVLFRRTKIELTFWNEILNLNLGLKIALNKILKLSVRTDQWRIQDLFSGSGGEGKPKWIGRYGLARPARTPDLFPLDYFLVATTWFI